jgi:uncharacterized phage protein gp47/JayE
MAGPYPLASLAATISATGITAPPYSDIIASLVASYQGIYGADVYLGDDAQDFQMLAIFAEAINDCNNATIAAYQSYSPTYAQGAGLASQVKINGIQKEAASNSTAVLTIVGDPGTVNNGVVSDGTNSWALPAVVNIPGGGEIDQTATCTTPGAILAAPGAISQIQNPQLGWISATNAFAATPGAPVESDAVLRQRQAVSVAGPAQTVKASIAAAVGNLPGVDSVVVYENATDATDGNGVTAHSICVIVIGGNAVQICQAIALHKPPGTPTFGSVSETVTDQAGQTSVINYQPAILVSVKAELDVHALTNYTTANGLIAATNAMDYVNSLGIGPTDIYLTKFMAAAQSDPTSITLNLFGAKLARVGGSLTAADLPLAFDEYPNMIIGNIAVVVS